jgi:hypothetical protein
MSDGRLEPNSDSIAFEPAVQPVESESTKLADGVRFRWLVWLALLAIATGFTLLRQVTTNLGVEAPSWDKSGRDYVWRVWWRVRHEIVDAGPSWGFTAVYIALALAFVALSALAVWIALVPNERAPSLDESPSADLAALQ